MTEIERLARPIYNAIKGWQDGVMPDLDTYSEALEWEQKDGEASGALDLAREAVRALLTALREPSEGMVEGMAKSDAEEIQEDHSIIHWELAFTAAIDVLLSDGGG